MPRIRIRVRCGSWKPIEREALTGFLAFLLALGVLGLFLFYVCLPILEALMR